MSGAKCIVHGCLNHKGEGAFVGDLCYPCYRMLTTGEMQTGRTFVHDLAKKLDPPIYHVSMQETSMKDYSILVIRKDCDPEYHPTVSQTFPTRVAEWIESLAALEAGFAAHLKKFSRR